VGIKKYRVGREVLAVLRRRFAQHPDIGAIRGKPLLRLTALRRMTLPKATPDAMVC